MQLFNKEGYKVPIKAWVDGVPIEDQARTQLDNMASLSIIHSHIAVMPDVHWGNGATVGSVIPMKGAIIPAAVGVDIGCGMMAVRTSLFAHQLPDNLKSLRSTIEEAVPVGRTDDGGANDKGAWRDKNIPTNIVQAWNKNLEKGFNQIVKKHPSAEGKNTVKHLGSLGTGNHFIEVCLDEEQQVWVMLHSGSRGIGNRMGSYFIELAKKDMRENHIPYGVPDQNLAYLREGTKYFDDYVEAVGWAQGFARLNREIMMENVLVAMRKHLPSFTIVNFPINCHHNYVEREEHFGEHVWLTRKGAVSAKKGEYGIIPGSMGAKSFIVIGKGNKDSFNSCSHGAGRKMSRTAARKLFTVEDHKRATVGVECRKDIDVIDETPAAYKDIDAVMKAQEDLVSVDHTLKQILCVKG